MNQQMQLILDADIKEELKKLESMLKTHDKYYDFSEDERIYADGEREWVEISKISNDLKIAGYSEEVKALFDKYYS